MTLARSTLLALCAATTLGACTPDALDPNSRLRDTEAKLSSARSDIDRFYVLPEAAKSSAAIGQFAKAEAYAQELLSISPKFPDNWNYGNGIHDANMVLGRVALHAGKRSEAVRFLLAAGETPGSPQLNSFGPNMGLADDLIFAGERDAVVSYFQLCDRFWKMDYGKLRLWAFEVQHGIHPGFGANLYY